MTSPKRISRQKAVGSRQKIENSRQDAGGGGQEAGLQSLIEKAYWRGFVEHGDLELALEDFIAHVNRIITKCLRKNPEQQADPMTVLANLHAEDLYLAAACALTNSNAAWERLAVVYNRYINTVAHSVCSTHQDARELASSVLAHLFLPDRRGRRRIATYEGRGPLCAWLAIIITRQGLNQGHLKAREALPLDTLRRTPSTSAASDIEAALIDSEYGEVIADSFSAAVESLSERERLVLALHIEDELTAAEIARRFHVHKSQPTRIIHRAEQKMRVALFTRLGTDHKMPAEARGECAANILRHRESSLATLLRLHWRERACSGQFVTNKQLEHGMPIGY